MLEPCDAVTLWLAIDAADEENGCVRYVRRSHHKGMREHGRTGTLGVSQGIVGFPRSEDAEPEVGLRVGPGDLLAHDALTIHRADANCSQTRSRRALGFIYYGERAKEDGEAHWVYQRKLADEMKAAGRL